MALAGALFDLLPHLRIGAGMDTIGSTWIRGVSSERAIVGVVGKRRGLSH